MQAKTRALAVGLWLAAPMLAACEPLDQTEPAAVAAAADGPSQAAEPADDPPPDDDAPPLAAEPAPPARPRDPRPVHVPPDLSREPVDLEEVLVVGARGGETLGEYRARADGAFDRLDINRDGRLDETEILSGVRQGRFAAALERADDDMDRAVSRREFDDLVTRAFQRLDADGNGMISEAELEAGDPLGTD